MKFIILSNSIVHSMFNSHSSLKTFVYFEEMSHTVSFLKKICSYHGKEIKI